MTPRSVKAQIAAIVAISLSVRLWLIFVFPVIFGGDSMVRLMNRNHILLSHDLPLLQFFIVLLSRISPDTLPIRLFMAAMGAVASVGFYLLASDFVDRAAAFWAALIFATNPFIVPVSIVPYQEILMLAGLLFALHFFFNQRWFAASLCLGLACLDRYEAWAACPVLALVYAQGGRFRPAQLLKSVLPFGWAPLAWLAFRRGLAPTGSYVLDHSLNLGRFARIGYIAYITSIQTPIPALLLAIGGVWLVFREQKWRDQRLQVVTAFVGLFSIALLFSAHGDLPDPNRYISSREAHIPLAAVAMLAAFALMPLTRLRLALAVLSVLLGSYGAYRYVQHETSRPENRLGYEVARYLDSKMQSGDQTLVLAKPLSSEDKLLYISKVRELEGAPGLRAARENLAAMGANPLDFQRILIHSRLDRSRLTAFPQIPSRIDWIVVWSDFAPSDARSAAWMALAAAHPVDVIQCADRSVRIWRAAKF